MFSGRSIYLGLTPGLTLRGPNPSPRSKRSNPSPNPKYNPRSNLGTRGLALGLRGLMQGGLTLCLTLSLSLDPRGLKNLDLQISKVLQTQIIKVGIETTCLVTSPWRVLLDIDRTDGRIWNYATANPDTLTGQTS